MDANLTIISRRENITAQANVKRNIVTFLYDKTDGQIQAVAFSVQRGTQGSPEFMGVEAFRGTVYGHAFNVENGNYQTGDSAIYEDIHAVCQSIINPEPQQDDTSV